MSLQASGTNVHVGCNSITGPKKTLKCSFAIYLSLQIIPNNKSLVFKSLQFFQFKLYAPDYDWSNSDNTKDIFCLLITNNGGGIDGQADSRRRLTRCWTEKEIMSDVVAFIAHFYRSSTFVYWEKLSRKDFKYKL